MKQFLFCSTVLNRKQYTVLDFKEEDLIEKINYLLTHRQDPVIWPLFVKSDIEEMLCMDHSLSSILKGLSVGSDKCKIRYNGWTYEVEEITPSSVISGYWKILTNCGNRLFDPAYIEFLASRCL